MAALRGTSVDSGVSAQKAARRAVLLLGTSLLVYTALPSAALAQDECGVPPPGGGTVTCTTAGNPYPNGIDYDPVGGLVADLTVVLQPGVIVTHNGNALHPNGVEMGTSTAGVDLVLQAGTITLISTNAANHDGVDVVSTNGSVSVAVDDVSTGGINSDAVIASGRGTVVVTGDTISTTGNYSYGVRAEEGDFILPGDPLGPIAPTHVTTNSVTTSGNGSVGISAFGEHAGVTVDSGTVITSGDNARGILALGVYGEVIVNSATVSTLGVNAIGIDAEVLLFPDETGPGASITIDSGSVTTMEDGALGILAGTPLNDITITSGTVSTLGDNARGISAFINGQFVAPNKYVYGEGDIVVDSGAVTTLGMNSDGIETAGADAITITSGSVSTHGDRSVGIYARAYFDGDIVITSGLVTTTGDTDTGDNYLNLGNAHGIEARANNGSVTITSTTVSTGDSDSGTDALGILATSNNGAVNIISGTVTTRGAGAIGISAQTNVPLPDLPAPQIPSDIQGAANLAPVALPPDISITSTTVSTLGAGAIGISATTDDGDIYVESGAVGTAGDDATGIFVRSGNARANGGNATVDSIGVTTTGDESTGIYAYSANGDTTVTSTGTVSTSGVGSHGIYALGADEVRVTSATVVTTEADSTGILVTQFGGAGDGIINIPTGAIAVLGPNGGTSVTSGSVTTGGAGSPGIDAGSAVGDTEVYSTGAISTSGAGSHGIIADSDQGFVLVDASAINVTGAGSDAIVITSATTSTVVVRGLVRSTSGLALQANGGPAAVSTTAPGTIRGRIDLTGGADNVSNAGTFDAIGTSEFGAGADVFNNTGTTRSTGGHAVLNELETFNNSGLVDFNDGAANDRLTVGNFNGTGSSSLTVDVDFNAGVSDVLVTGVATGSTIINVNASGSQFGFSSTGILVVDATAGTPSTAFSLAGGNFSNGYITAGLIFDAPNFNFLLVNAPGQPIFETALVGGMTLDVWHVSADAVETQLEAARAPSGTGPIVSHLTSGGRLGGWIHVFAGETERDATQSFTSGGTTTTFDVSYEQDYEGLQAGFDHQSGPVIFGLTFGLGQSDSQFETSPSTVEMETKNVGAYLALTSGSFYFNALAKVDWIDLETNPGAGLVADFDATAYGVRAVAGFRFDLGDFYAEPSVSLSWVTSSVDDYQSGGATISFDNATSLRGTAGLRVGGIIATGGGGVLSPFAGIRIVEEFSNDNQNDFFLGTTLNLMDDGPGTHGEASAGLNFTSGSVEAFVRGELDFGSDVEGRTVRGGVRLRF